ncbi:MAG: SbcC/MukB-like Walker B domain-containing protein, partial [Lachnospiraceae bacterium]|nr:SbcC/MukB-like Walker B domain-containing protein [Lachnospiraceae bacterium]
FTKKPQKGSLAEEIETEDPDARLYADYLLGNVMKCENVSELNRYQTAITKNVMLYKGYVSRRLNPARYADPFIGRRSLEILLEKLTKEKENAEKDFEWTADAHRIAKNAAAAAVMSNYEAQQHSEAVEKAQEIPVLTETLEELQKEYDSIDFTYLEKLKDRILEKKGIRKVREKEQEENSALAVKAEVKLEHLVDAEIPAVQEKLLAIKEEIRGSFAEEWIRDVGEVRFQKELKARENRQSRGDDAFTMSLKDSFTRARNQTRTVMEGHERDRRRKRVEYNQEYRMPYDTERSDNEEYDAELHTLADIKLPSYIDQIRDAREKAYEQFRDDFIAKLKSNIESVREQIAELNYSLKDSVFGTDRYRFVMKPRAEYRNYYDMITDPMLMDTGGWNLASRNFNQKYQKEIDSLFKALIINETDVSAERRAEYEKNIKKFTDYKTYLVFDLIVTNDQGEEQHLSKTLLKKSGGETQIPFYIALLASFSQICRIRVKGHNNTVRLIILDEAFSKMDGERIREGISLLRRFGLQAIFSAPPEKIPDIAPLVDSNIAVYKSGHHSFTRHFDPAQVNEAEE